MPQLLMGVAHGSEPEVIAWFDDPAEAERSLQWHKCVEDDEIGSRYWLQPA